MNSHQLEKVKELLRFLQPAFPTTRPAGPAYENMAALLADVSLQAGVNYQRVVWPRVRSILQQHPECRGTADVLRILKRVTTQDLLQWKGSDKVARFENILNLIVRYHIRTIEDLAIWSDGAGARATLLGIRGIGEKTVDYLRLLCGKASFPIDRHFIRFLKLAGVDVKACGYSAAQQLLMDSCADLGIEPRLTEKSLWLLLSSCG
jgi:endonuclease III